MTARTLTFPLFCALLAGFALPRVSGAEIARTPKEYTMPRATMKIDGDLGDWQLDRGGYSVGPSQAGNDPAIRLFISNPDNPFKGPADLSARVAVAWDDEHLYIAGKVTDDDLRGIKPNTAHNVGPAGWKCDSVMFRIHSFRQPLRSNSPHTPTPFVGLRYEVPADGRGRLIDDRRRVLDKPDMYWKLPEGSLLASRETPQGYQVEAAVPWRAFGYRPQAGEVLLCGFLLADIDTDERLNQLGWHFDREPRQMAVFRLLGRPEATGLLSPAASAARVGKRWSVSYRVDARTADVRVKRLVLIGPDGETASLPIDLSVPKGRTGADVAVVEKLPDRAGKYQARLDVEIHGETAALATEDFEILPGAPPAPIIRNRPGELHHQRPDRVAHSAFEDHRRKLTRHGFVKDRSGYERYILTHAKDYVDSQMEPAFQRKDKNIVHKVLKTYALHKLTGEPQYAEWTRRGLQLAIANQKRKIDLHLLFPLVVARYYIWLHDPKTPLAPPNVEEDFQNIWAQVAAKPDSKWMFTEWGYHNRCWHRWAIHKIARHFARKLGKPVDPRIDEYIAWHDPLLAHFGAATDNSSGYHWVGFRYPVYWHMATDTLAELAKHEGWLAALHRWRRYSSPSGAVPNFGDTSGWGSGVGPAMMYYELMGRITRDGRFRWQAHRIAEYMYNHFWPRHDQYHLPRDRTADAFCLAWLNADDSVKPVPPKRQSTVTFRTRCVEPTEEEKAGRPGFSGLKLTDELVPDKLILTSGNDATHLWSFVELIDLGGHCGHLPGNIIVLMQHDAALLAGPSYNEESCNLNNIMWIEDMDGLATDPRPMRAEVPRFMEDRAVTYARIRVPRFRQMPLTYVREIVFVKNGFMLVKDRVTFHAMMKVRVGPCWQTRDLGPQCGDDWFNTYFEWIYHTGLGLGKGVHAYRNPAWDLLVRFAPREETRCTVDDRYEDNPWRPSPTGLRQSWAGIAEPGDTKTFTTILLPHAPGHDVTPFADWATFVVDNDDTTLVRVRTEFDSIHHFQETHWMLLQERPQVVEADGFLSDAAFALVSIDRRGKQRPAVMVDGSALRLNGEDGTAKARKPKVESVFVVGN